MAPQAQSPQRGTDASRVLRAALVGLGLGLLLGGLYLMAVGLLGLREQVECPPELALSECAIEQEVAARLGRTQLFAGVGLVVLSVATFLGVRARDRRLGGSKH